MAAVQTVYRFSLTALFIILSFLPNLITKTNAAWYRCSMALTALIAILLIWALKEWFSFLFKPLGKLCITGILVIGYFYGIYQAGTNVLLYRVMPSVLEFSYVKKKIDLSLLEKSKMVHIVLPLLVNKAQRYDEFLTPTVNYFSTTCLMIISAIREKQREEGQRLTHFSVKNGRLITMVFKNKADGDRPTTYSFQFEFSYKSENLDLGEPAMVVDLREVPFAISKFEKQWTKQ